MGNTTELFKLGQSKASAYIGRATPTRPLEVTALNIPAGCQIQFDLVEYFDHLTKDEAPCGQIGDVYSSDRGRFPYTICDCKPFLDSNVQRLYIDAPGHYVAVIVPETGCLGKIEAYVREAPEMAGNLDNALRGCCGSPKADLQVTKTTAKPRYKAGEFVTYTIRALNAGPSDASGAILKDVLPSEMVVTGIALAYGNGAIGAATATPAQLTNFEIAAFPPSGYVDVAVTGAFAKDGSFNNKASITPPEGVIDPNLSNNAAEVQVIIESLKPKLKINKTVSNANPLVGDTGSFTLTITNTGVDADTSVILKDVLPAGLTYVEPFAVTNTTAVGVPVTVTSVQLAAGANIAATFPVGAVVTVAIPYAVTAAAGKTLTNIAEVKGALSESEDFVNLSIDPPARIDLCGKAIDDASAKYVVAGNLKGCDSQPLLCDAKLKQCCDVEVIVDSVSSRPAPAGVCLIVEPQGYTFTDKITGFSFLAPNKLAALALNPNAVGGRAILQLRDKAVLEGQLQLDPNGNPGAVASKIFANPFECDALLEVDLYVNDNYAVGANDVYDKEAMTMVHKIGTTLAEPYPAGVGAGIDRSVGVHNLNSTGANIGNAQSGTYNAETAWMGEYQVVVPAGGSVTVIAQSWAVFYENKSSGGFVIHANKDLKGRWTKGGRIV